MTRTRHTQSQLDRLTALLEAQQPHRAVAELLDSGAFYVALCNHDVNRPDYLVCLGRRGEELRSAMRVPEVDGSGPSATWNSWTGRSENLERLRRILRNPGGYIDRAWEDRQVIAFVRGEL